MPGLSWCLPSWPPVSSPNLLIPLPTSHLINFAFPMSYFCFKTICFLVLVRLIPNPFPGSPYLPALSPTHIKPSLLQPRLGRELRDQKLSYFIAKRTENSPERVGQVKAFGGCKLETNGHSHPPPAPQAHPALPSGNKEPGPCMQPPAGSAYGKQPRLHGNSERGENIMCISTNYSRKGTQPGRPEIVCCYSEF